MDAPPSLARLAIGGLLLDQRAFRAQRDDPAGLRRGALLVLVIGLLVGAASLIGDLGEYLTQPDPQLLADTIAQGVAAMPWYTQAVQADPQLGTAVQQIISTPGLFARTPSPLVAALGVLLTPLISLASWLIGGSLVHIAARAFGGVGRFGQTLATTALTASAGLLGLIYIVPYAPPLPFGLFGASLLLSLTVSYVAVRETHGLQRWRAFWAVLIGPLLLSLLVVGLYCCVVVALASSASGLSQGVR